ncbi:MAG TPA: molybdopterin converting factor subunit 1 [Burkholderiales bacterium]
MKLLYFAALREQVGVSAEEIDLPAGVTTLGALRAHLAARGGAWAEALGETRLLRAAVNQDMGQADTLVRAGDEVAFFPPVTGG